MMHKKSTGLLLLLICLWLLGGCTATVANPLEKAEATAVPGLNMRLHAASASEDNVDTFQATLYFRYLDEPLLAAETRMLTVRRDESMELAVVRALLEGPSAGHSDLKRLFPATVEVESISARDSILYITFSEALLTDDDIPEDWSQQSEWQTEAPLLRKLIIQSVVASITESFPYTGIQILVYRPSILQTSLRLDNTYFLGSDTGLSDPQVRNEALLLTPQNTASAILAAWQNRNDESLYNYIASGSEDDARPSYQDVALQLDECPSLSTFSLSGGNVSMDGQHCVVTVSLSILGDEEIASVTSYPLPLIRENGVWKITFTQLQSLMNR